MTLKRLLEDPRIPEDARRDLLLHIHQHEEQRKFAFVFGRARRLGRQREAAEVCPACGAVDPERLDVAGPGVLVVGCDRCQQELGADQEKPR